MENVIINSPSLDPAQNVSGISAVVQFLMSQNKDANYIHFEIGRKDGDKGGISRLFSILRSLKGWRLLLKQHPNAIVHFNFALTKSCIIRDSLYIWEARKKKLLVHLHGGNYLFSDNLPFYIQLLLRRLFKKDCPFIVLSEKEKDHIERKYHCNTIYSLPNCIDLTDARGYQKEYNEGVVMLGYIGRISSEKGMKELLQACKVLLNDNFPYKLIIAGSEREGDTYLEEFKNELGDHFEYEGIVFGASKTLFFKKVQVFILPSYFEGLPISLIETMSFGCVPVTTNVGSISTVVTDEENGLFIETKSSDDIVSKIKYLTKDKTMVERLGRKARETIFEKFDPHRYILSLQEIYESL